MKRDVHTISAHGIAHVYVCAQVLLRITDESGCVRLMLAVAHTFSTQVL